MPWGQWKSVKGLRGTFHKQSTQASNRVISLQNKQQSKQQQQHQPAKWQTIFIF